MEEDAYKAYLNAADKYGVAEYIRKPNNNETIMSEPINQCKDETCNRPTTRNE